MNRFLHFSMVHDRTESNMPIELRNDFQAGLFIKDQLIPNAVLYYLNEIDDDARAKEILIL